MCALGVASFLASFAFAAARYPGGTWFDPRAPGHSLALNFLCDLMQTRALNGADATLGSRVARAGAVSLLVAIAAFYALVADIAPHGSRARGVIRGAGLAAALLGCAVPLAPSDLFRNAHLVAVGLAFVPALIATIAAARVCVRAPGLPRVMGALAVLTLASAAVDGLGYAYGYALYFANIRAAHMAYVSLALPVLQRVALLGLLGWMATVCVHALRHAPRR